MKRDERDEIFTVLSFPLFLSFSRSLCPSPSHIRIHTDSHTLIYDIFISIGLRIERHMNSSLSLSPTDSLSLSLSPPVFRPQRSNGLRVSIRVVLEVGRISLVVHHGQRKESVHLETRQGQCVREGERERKTTVGKLQWNQRHSREPRRRVGCERGTRGCVNMRR